jgi:transcription initiation factor TFIIIB Brf1 subunit/transcription initiation factor TFIIB
MHRHPQDPPAQHDAAEKLGAMVADGLITEQEAQKTMAVIVRVAFQNAPTVDRKGLRTRLVWSARDSRHARETARANAQMAVRWACRPLIQSKAPKAATLEAARKAAGTVLTDAELLPILAEEWDRAHRRRGRK